MRNPDLNPRIIVFDGYCHLCSAWARFVERHPSRPPFKLIPMQSEEGKALLVAHQINPEDPTTFLVLDGAQHFTASDAAIHVIAALGHLWHMIYLVRVIPRRWRDGIYRVVARNRFRWFGRRATCYPRP
jgi:predicted DCC family thiol-disulfide oxidoreductase YuxK